MTDQKNANSAVTPGVTVNFLLTSVKDRDLTPYLRMELMWAPWLIVQPGQVMTQRLRIVKVLRH
jgi:hypothetical protein